MKWFNRLFKRQVETTPTEDRSFVPLGSGGASYGSIYSPQVARCLALYVDFLINCPLKAKNEDDPFYRDVLQKRICPYLSNQNFYQLLIQNYFLWGNFYAIIKVNDRGEILALLPYASPQAVQPYPTNFKKRERGDPTGDWGDPEKLFYEGYFYRDYRARTYSPDQMLHIKSAAFNTSTGLVEGEAMAQRAFNSTYEAAARLEAVIENLTARDLRPPLLLTGLGYGEGQDIKLSSRETKSVKNTLREYFENDSQGSRGVLALPAGFKVDKMSFDQSNNTLSITNDIVTSNICNLFNIPRSLVFTSGNTERDTKEARRIFISNGFKGMCTIIEQEYNRLTDWQNEFHFDLDKLRYMAADLREEAATAQLANVLSPEEIKEKMNLN